MSMQFGLSPLSVFCRECHLLNEEPERKTPEQTSPLAAYARRTIALSNNSHNPKPVTLGENTQKAAK
ncbi:hypothetical protein QOT17_015256 [Balamuthia mandrillaris]